MADNPTLPATGSAVAADDISSVLYPRIKLVHGADGTNAGDVATANPLPVLATPRFFATAASAYTRPANTTAYAAGDAVSNNGTAGSVTAISFTLADLNDAPLTIERCRIASTDTGVAGKQFTVYLFNSDPTASSGVGGGDNAAWSQKQAGFIGTLQGVFRAFSDGSVAVATPFDGLAIKSKPSSGGQTIYALLQTNDAFTPSANSTTFTLTLEGEQGRA